ncbi:hypothetical protein GJ688_02700 [Heliobacillus mobilis]|uniref:Uncharacterized protein n=1 Tax=Heliobacterium mobile TaxID=28064 RepID=A0A6I3SC08_HELMO|nr:hypothetical protein [Heliobacterium mobile]MTV47892.1 hypothetical protein [Heliobacterium mobile]
MTLTDKVCSLFLSQKVAYLIMPSFRAFCLNRNVKKGIDKLAKEKDEYFYLEKVKLDRLEKLYSKEQERRKTIEDKAKVNVTGITLALTLLSSSITFLNGTKTSNIKLEHGVTEDILLLLFLSTFIYLFLGALDAIKALQLGLVYDIYLSDEIKMASKGSYLRCLELSKSIHFNYKYNTIKENFVTSSYDNIKNAIIALLLLVLLGSIMYVINGNNEKIQDKYKMLIANNSLISINISPCIYRNIN